MCTHVSWDPAARSRLSGEYLSTDTAEVGQSSWYSGLSVASSKTTSRPPAPLLVPPPLPPAPPAPPTAMWCEGVSSIALAPRAASETAQARQANLAAHDRTRVRMLAFQTNTWPLSSTETRRWGLLGWQATHRTLPAWPCTSTSGSASTSHTSQQLVPATNTSEPGWLSSARSAGRLPFIPGRRSAWPGPALLPSLPFVTSQECTMPSAPPLSSVRLSARSLRHRTPPNVTLPSGVTISGPVPCAARARTTWPPRQRYSFPLGIPVTMEPSSPGLLGGRKTQDSTLSILCFPNLRVVPNQRPLISAQTFRCFMPWVAN
mmetsp:Transcript_32089/g.61761  ORF Transcript_32089/g.61761 Transcript_32089/m.61761 type:complete len:318 (-) Transcript_32089:1584-2537(-)